MSILFSLAITAAFGCALCNGLAAILQKIGADRFQPVTTFNLTIVWQLLRNWPYILGLLLDGVAWLLTLVAVHYLPLFVAQPIIALSVVVSVLIERYVYKRTLSTRSLSAIGLILIGLALIATQAQPESATQPSTITFIYLLLAPIPIALLGVAVLRRVTHRSASLLAGLAGLSFGGVALIGRVAPFATSHLAALFSPVFIALLAYGGIGIALFTVALQRGTASSINAVMVAFETLVPILLGMLLLGDSPRSGHWLYVVGGALLATAGTVIIAASADHTSQLKIKKDGA